MKKHSLQVEHVGGDELIVMSKGHHDPDEFMAAVQALIGVDAADLMPPSHEWTRTLPDRSGEYVSHYIKAEPHSRGAFPTTYTREAFDGEPYKFPQAAVTNQNQPIGRHHGTS